MKGLLALALPLFALDQLTKWWVVWNIEFRSELRPVIDNYFYLCHWDNTGSAFGMFKNFNAGFIVVSVVGLIAITVFQRRGAFRDLPSRWGVGLLLGGILGNLSDRLIHGYVVDFLLFDLHGAVRKSLAGLQRRGLMHLHRGGPVHPQLVSGNADGEIQRGVVENRMLWMPGSTRGGRR